MTIVKIIWNCGALIGCVSLTYIIARIVKLSSIPDSSWERWLLVVVVILWGTSSFLRALGDLIQGKW